MKYQKITFYLFIFFIFSIYFSCDTLPDEIPELPEPTEELDLLTDCTQVLEHWQHTFLTGPDVLQKQHDIFFPSKNIGYTVGVYGTITKTEDGGRTWHLIQAGTFDNYITRLLLQSVYFVDEEQGFVAGTPYAVTSGEEYGLGAVLLKTTDGGSTWEKYYFENVQRIHDMYFYNAEVGYGIFGIEDANGYSYDKLMRTENAGKDWTIVDLPIARIESSRLCSSPSKLYLFAKDNAQNPVLLSLDKMDMTLHIQELPQTECNRLHFINDEIKFMTCGVFSAVIPDKVYQTEDAGNSWVEVESPINSTSLFHFTSMTEGFVITPLYQPNGHFLDIIAFDVFQTENGGIDWDKSSYSPSCDFIRGSPLLSFVPADDVVVIYTGDVHIFERK